MTSDKHQSKPTHHNHRLPETIHTLSGSLFSHKKSCPLRQLFHFHHIGLAAALLAVAASRSGLAAHLAVFQHGCEIYRIAGIIHTLCLQ